MNYYEQKQEQKKERYENLAKKNRELATEKWKSASSILDGIPFGQPILVGHHSEKAHRNLLEKSHNRLRNSIKIGNKADYYEQKANSVGTGGISSDDPEAIKKLKEKLEKLEDIQKGMKEANAKARTLKIDKVHPTWQLSNNNANIRNTKLRIKKLEAQAKMVEREDEKGFGWVLKEDKEENRIKFIFEGKPEEKIRTLLKSNGFRWSPYNKAWQRMLNANGRYSANIVKNKLPDYRDACVDIIDKALEQLN